MARQSRQLVASSPAFLRLKDGDADEEIHEALTDEIMRELPVAIAGVRFELAPPAAAGDLAALAVEIGAYLRFGGGMMGQEAKDEFIQGVLSELREFPLSLLAGSIPRSRKRIRGPWEMVAWVVEDIEPTVDRLKLEEERMARLLEIAAA